METRELLQVFPWRRVIDLPSGHIFYLSGPLIFDYLRPPYTQEYLCKSQTDKNCIRGHTSPNDQAAATIVENKFGFSEILKHINDLANRIELNDVLMKAEYIYLKIKEVSQVLQCS